MMMIFPRRHITYQVMFCIVRMHVAVNLTSIFIVDILLYFGEALLQCIESFYSNFVYSTMQPLWKETSLRMFSSLLVCCHGVFSRVHRSNDVHTVQGDYSLCLYDYVVIQKLDQPLLGNRVYFSIEVQVKQYRRTVHVLKKVLNTPCGRQNLHVSH